MGGNTIISGMTAVAAKRSRFAIAALLSVVLAAYGPMVSVSNAQAAMDAQKLTQLKEKAVKEIDRRIGTLEQTLESLNADVKLDKESLQMEIAGGGASASASIGKDGAKAQATGKDGTTANVSLEGTDVNGNIEVSQALKNKVKETVQRYIAKLKAMKEKASGSTQLADIQALGKGVDSQFGLDQLSNVQGTVTKSIESLTGVFDKLKSTANDLQSQVAKLKECANGLAGGDGSATVGVKDGSVTANAFAPGCKELNVGSKDIAAAAQSQLDNVGTMMMTMGSVLMSVISLVASLVTSFSSLTGSLGDLSKLGDVSGSGGIGNVGGLLGSFSAVTSQLDLVSGMAGNAQGLLGSVSDVTSAFNF